MDNNEVYTLFEDIKNALKGINGKLENTPKATNNQSDGQSPTVDLTPIRSCSRVPQGASGTDQSHADQVRGSGSLRIEQDFTLVAWIERIIHPKFGRTAG